MLEAFRAGDGVDLVRESVRLVLLELIEAEAAEAIGAAAKNFAQIVSPNATVHSRGP